MKCSPDTPEQNWYDTITIPNVVRDGNTETGKSRLKEFMDAHKENFPPRQSEGRGGSGTANVQPERESRALVHPFA